MEETDSQYTGGAESGTPYVSLRRTYTILLLVYGLGAVFALLAGAALTWHVDPYSECLLYSHPVRDRIEYGHEASEYLELETKVHTKGSQWRRPLLGPYPGWAGVISVIKNLCVALHQ